MPSPSLPRQMPEKLTTAPMSVRPCVSSALSRAMSKSASWMRIVTLVMANTDLRRHPSPLPAGERWFFAAAVVSFASALAAGHRREEGDLAGACDRRVLLDMGVVDCRADHLRLLEGVRVAFALVGQPGDQIVDGAHVGRRLDGFFRLADALAHPGEVFHLHPSSSLMRWWMPARK